jgi:hypothetical protein
MPCKIDHSSPENIPVFLCLTCTPRTQPPRSPEHAPLIATLKPEDAERYARKHRRRLRAEVRELASDLDKLRAGRAGRELIEAAESKWRNAYSELALTED